MEVPYQAAYIAARFFFTRAEFLTDVPFDPYLPWVFMEEEIALSIRAWTHGWSIYAPRFNYIAHQYRPGRIRCESLVDDWSLMIRYILTTCSYIHIRRLYYLELSHIIPLSLVDV